MVRAPFSPLGHDPHVKTKNATCMARATTQPISVSRNESIVRNFPNNNEQEIHDIYRSAFSTPSVDGTVLVAIASMPCSELLTNSPKQPLTYTQHHTANQHS